MSGGDFLFLLILTLMLLIVVVIKKALKEYNLILIDKGFQLQKIGYAFSPVAQKLFPSTRIQFENIDYLQCYIPDKNSIYIFPLRYEICGKIRKTIKIYSALSLYDIINLNVFSKPYSAFKESIYQHLTDISQILTEISYASLNSVKQIGQIYSESLSNFSTIMPLLPTISKTLSTLTNINQDQLDLPTLSSIIELSRTSYAEKLARQHYQDIINEFEILSSPRTRLRDINTMI